MHVPLFLYVQFTYHFHNCLGEDTSPQAGQAAPAQDTFQNTSAAQDTVQGVTNPTETLNSLIANLSTEEAPLSAVEGEDSETLEGSYIPILYI